MGAPRLTSTSGLFVCVMCFAAVPVQYWYLTVPVARQLSRKNDDDVKLTFNPEFSMTMTSS